MVPPGFEPGTLTTWKWCDNQLHHETLQQYRNKLKNKVGKRKKYRVAHWYNYVIHYGVVGNIQASHVCAPGSIPGDGVF